MSLLRLLAHLHPLSTFRKSNMYIVGSPSKTACQRVKLNLEGVIGFHTILAHNFLLPSVPKQMQAAVVSKLELLICQASSLTATPIAEPFPVINLSRILNRLFGKTGEILLQGQAPDYRISYRHDQSIYIIRILLCMNIPQHFRQ